MLLAHQPSKPHQSAKPQTTLIWRGEGRFWIANSMSRLMLIHRNVQLSRWENIPVLIPGASSVASGLWCLSIKPKNPYIEKAWFGLSWDFFVRYLCSPSAAAGDAPATSPCCCAMRCFQGSKRRVTSKLLFRRHGHGPSMWKQVFVESVMSCAIFSSRVSCIVLSFKCHSGKGVVSSCNLWRAAGW